MKIVSKLTIKEKQEEKINYPVLIKHINYNLIILLSAPKTGVVLVDDNGYHQMGEFRNDWLFPNSYECFTILPPGSKVEICVEA